MQVTLGDNLCHQHGHTTFPSANFMAKASLCKFPIRFGRFTLRLCEDPRITPSQGPLTPLKRPTSLPHGKVRDQEVRSCTGIRALSHLPVRHISRASLFGGGLQYFLLAPYRVRMTLFWGFPKETVGWMAILGSHSISYSLPIEAASHRAFTPVDQSIGAVVRAIGHACKHQAHA